MLCVCRYNLGFSCSHKQIIADHWLIVMATGPNFTRHWLWPPAHFLDYPKSRSKTFNNKAQILEDNGPGAPGQIIGAPCH
jgi:hypothetical protein